MRQALEDDGPVLSALDAGCGRVRVLSRQCVTCIFARGNRMALEPGRVAHMVADALAGDGHIVCHDTLPYGRYPQADPAVCRGFWNRHRLDSLFTRLALCLGSIDYVDPPGQVRP